MSAFRSASSEPVERRREVRSASMFVLIFLSVHLHALKLLPTDSLFLHLSSTNAVLKPPLPTHFTFPAPHILSPSQTD